MVISIPGAVDLLSLVPANNPSNHTTTSPLFAQDNQTSTFLDISLFTKCRPLCSAQTAINSRLLILYGISAAHYDVNTPIMTGENKFEFWSERLFYDSR
jgi:hypothetical protein